MTSKSLFFTLMKEGMKRRLWAVAFSLLTFFFAMPMAAAMGSSMTVTWRAPALAAAWRTARRSTSVTPEGTVYGEGDPYEQAKYIFTKLVKLLEDNGVSREEVVKVNIFATSSSYNNEITKAYSEYFKESRPCCTWIGIKELNRPSQLVEIEMQAIIGAKA